MAFIENPEINLIESQSCSHTSGFLYIFNSGLTDGKLLQLTEIWNYIYIFKNELWCDIIILIQLSSIQFSCCKQQCKKHIFLATIVRKTQLIYKPNEFITEK